MELQLIHTPSILTRRLPKFTFSEYFGARKSKIEVGFLSNCYKNSKPAIISNNAIERGDADTAVVVDRPPPKLRRFEVFTGHPTPFGATLRDGGVNFAVVSSNASSATLCLISLSDLPEKISPSPYTVQKGAFDTGGPVLKRTFQDEHISISVMRMADIIPGGDAGGGDDGINQLFLHVDISKPGQQESLHFLCGLYPDALGIHSVSLRSKAQLSGSFAVPTKYNGPVFEDIDEQVRDGLHSYIEERGINESLFPFLQAWLYVKDHRNLVRWFKTIGTFVNDTN